MFSHLPDPQAGPSVSPRRFCYWLFLRRVIAVTGSSLITGARQKNFDVTQSPIALLVFRDVSEDVLVLQLVGDLSINGFHLFIMQRGINSAAGARREIGHQSLGVFKTRSEERRVGK